ncbi:MAG: hypothetical protein JW861_11895 [Bacteroidales bacterium]|nr:hypothetical protein [Bacteroidales bacterium]
MDTGYLDIRYHPGLTDQAFAGMFRNYAEYTLEDIDDLMIRVKYVTQCVLREEELNYYTVDAGVKVYDIEGAVSYRGFLISDVWHPSSVLISMQVKNGVEEVYGMEYCDMPAGEDGRYQMTFGFEHLPESKRSSVKFTIHAFHADTSNAKKLIDRISRVNDCYSASLALDSMLAGMKVCRFSAKSLIPNLIRYWDAGRLLRLLDREQFEMLATPNPDDDPAGFRVKYKKAVEVATRFRVTLEDQLTHQVPVIPSQSIHELAGYFVARQTWYQDFSYHAGYQHSLYFMKLSRMEPDAGWFRIIDRDLEWLGKEIFRVPESVISTFHLYQALWNAYQSAVLNALGKEDFVSASDLLDNARLVMRWNNTTAPLMFNMLLSRSVYGIYHAYMYVAEKAVDVGNYEMAESYIRKADKVRRDHPSLIISSKGITDIYISLIELYIIRGKELLDRAGYSEAIHCFDQAFSVSQAIGYYNFEYDISRGRKDALNGRYLEILTMAGESQKMNRPLEAWEYLQMAKSFREYHSLLIYPDEHEEQLMTLILQGLYWYYIESGESLLRNAKPGEAYEEFLFARQLESEQHYPASIKLALLMRDAARMLILENTEKARIRIINDNLEEARTFYEYSISLSEGNGLCEDQEVKQQLSVLLDEIKGKECQYAQIVFEQYRSEALNSFEQGEFSHGGKFFIKALQLAESFRCCELADTAFTDLMNYYFPAVRYDSLRESAVVALEDEDYVRFQYLYREMDSLSRSTLLIREHQEKWPLILYFEEPGNEVILQETAKHYAFSGHPRFALLLLETMRKTGVPARQTQDLQERIAEQILKAANQSVELQPDELLADEASLDEEWYSFFLRSCQRFRRQGP